MNDTEPSRYPLEWPDDQPRTDPTERFFGPYTVKMTQARDELLVELERMKANHVVISSNQTLRRDGLPRASQKRRLGDPGAAVYWTRDGVDYVVACDTYTTVCSNLRAIGLTIYHLRRLEASAPSFLADRAYKGFARLPANANASWRTVMGFDAKQTVTQDDIRGAFRRLVRICHPDHGGTNDQMSELNRARSEAVRETA